MAIAFAKMSVHTRSQGHSAVAGAAYRAGIILKDERTGEVHDFQNRDDVKYSQIILPEGANIKYSDRTYLWNQTEACEKRKDSQVAKDIILALPKGLDLDKQIELTRSFAEDHFVVNGLVADIAIHDHGDENPHAHIYITTRRLLGEKFDIKKARDLNPEFGKGFVMTQDFWGEQWGDFQNDFFKKHSIDLRVDANHIIAQKHEGRIRGRENHYVKEENKLRRQMSIDIALNDPTSVLNILGNKYSVFGEREIGALLSKNTQTLEQYQTALVRLKAHRDLILLGPGKNGKDCYTTRSNYLREAHMGDLIHDLELCRNHSVSNAYIRKTAENFGLNQEQTDALRYIGKGADICALVGRAGTGKTYLMKAAKEMWEKQGYKIHGMAVSGRAAKGLETATGIKSSTIHSIKMQIAYGTYNIGAKDIIVIDEAGMTNLYDMSIMIQLARETGAKLVVVGDHAQLQPIGAGAPFRSIVEQAGFAELNKIMRQEVLGDREASALLASGNIAAAIDHYQNSGQIYLGQETNTTTKLIADWSKNITQENLHDNLILAYRNIDVQELNIKARTAILNKGLLRNPLEFGNIVLAEGERILFLANNKELGVNNGDFATVLKIANKDITAKLDTGAKVTFSANEYQDFNYGYAATVHKSQGATVDNVYVYIAGFWDRFLTYVALTRHREKLRIYVDSKIQSLTALKHTLNRGKFKDAVLDWPISYAIRRGFDPEKMLGRFIDKVVEVKQVIKDKWLFVANYEVYLRQKNHKIELQNKAEKRQAAKTVATFVDIQKNLGQKWRTMSKELQPAQKIHEHPEYRDTYAQMLVKNQLGAEIYRNIDQYQSTLQENSINPDKLKDTAKSHERFERAYDYVVRSYKQKEPVDCYSIAKEINTNLSDYYGHLSHLTHKHDIDFKDVTKEIEKDAVQYDKINSIGKPTKERGPEPTHEHSKKNNLIANTITLDEKQPERINASEWERLKSIESSQVKMLFTIKDRLDKAKSPLSKKVQKQAYDKAVENIVANPALMEKIKAIAPKIASQMKALVKHRENSIEREYRP